MNFAIALFTPLALLLPGSSLSEMGQKDDPPETLQAFPAHAGPVVGLPYLALSRSRELALSYAGQGSDEAGAGLDARGALGGSAWRVVVEGHRPQTAYQVHIEQRTTIRIVPRPLPMRPMRPDMFMGIPNHDEERRFLERKIGKCLPVAAIAGVQASKGNRLILSMRDRRIVGAELERACRARDFYSGFYIASPADGQLCVDRDTLLSRSGVNCKLTRIRQLIEIDP